MDQSTKNKRLLFVIGGSRTVDPHAALAVIDELMGLSDMLDRPFAVLLRRGRDLDSAGPFEKQAAEYCRREGIPVEWHVPNPGGRAEVFYRDIEMVTAADLTICVFSQDSVMMGGTGHLIEKAIDQGIPAYAYCYDGRVLDRVGEFDPMNIWGEYLPA